MATEQPLFELEYILALNRWDELVEYLNRTEEFLQKAQGEFESWASEQIKRLSDTQRQEFYEYYADDYVRYQEGFPRILRNSFFISAYSLMEYEMGMICKRLQRKKQIPIRWNDLRGDVLERAKLYCKLTGLDLPYDDQTWQEINRYSKVRNCIVHKSGLLKEFQGDQDLIAYITRKGIISQDTIEQEIALTEQFCREVASTIHAFLEKIRIALAKL